MSRNQIEPPDHGNNAISAYSEKAAAFSEIKSRIIVKSIASQLNPDSPTTHILDSGLKNFGPIRLAGFSSLLSPNSFRNGKSNDLPLLSILSTLGCLVNHRQLCPSLTSPKHSNEVLLCAFCQLAIPLSDIFKHNALSKIQYTARLLEELSVLHAAECSGRLGAVLLRQDDVRFPVAEKTLVTSTSFTLPGTKTTTRAQHVLFIDMGFLCSYLT